MVSGLKKVLYFISVMVLAGSISFAGGYIHKKKNNERISDTEIRKLEKIHLSYEIKDGDIYFSWTPATGQDSGGVKMAYSSSHSQPLYPYDGYVKWMPGGGHSSCVVPGRKAASTETRYYRVCSVKPGNHSEYTALSNVVTVPPVGGAEKSKIDDYQKKAKNYKHKDENDIKTVMICPSCGWKGRSDFQFCAKCGTQLVKKEPVMGCPSCGWEGKPGYNFCVRCGTKLQEI